VDRDWWLTTPRLALRRFTRDDLAWLVEFHSDLDVTRYLTRHTSAPDIAELLDGRILRYYDEHPGLGIWQTIERSTGEPIGYHLLNHIRGESIVQVGYALRKASWGYGYASEMARAVVRHGFATQRLPVIAGMASLENVVSHRVLLKIGLERRGQRALQHPAYAPLGPMAWFEAESAAWLAHAAQIPPL
jgi:RimJ/RimL family protein N-acetyltransferase